VRLVVSLARPPLIPSVDLELATSAQTTWLAWWVERRRGKGTGKLFARMHYQQNNFGVFYTQFIFL